MIRSHVILPTSARKASNSNRTRVPSVTDSAGSDRAVSVRPSHAVALLTSACFSRRSFQLGQWIGRAASATRLVRFRKIHLLGRESFLTINRSPGGSAVATTQELLINVLVTRAAVSCC